jgi:Cu2+-exporting ATPase
MRSIESLNADHKMVWCLSGDRQDRVSHFASQVNLSKDHVVSEATPDAKQAFVKAQQAQGKRVLMVGDGLNDAPVLAQADVSIAVKSAAPLARQKADIYLLREGLDGVTQSLFVARQAKRILNQNLAWALAYNIIAIPFAAAGLISPLVASIGMAASSLLVVLNSSRLLKVR